MKFQFQLLLVAQIFFRGIALLYLWRRRQIIAWWPLATWLLIGEIRQIALLLASGSIDTYRPVLAVAQRINAPMAVLLAWSAVHGVGRHYLRPYPSLLLAVLCGLTAGYFGALWTWTLGTFAGASEFELRLERFGWIVLLMGILIGLLRFSRPWVAISWNCQVHALCSVAFFVVGVIGKTIQLGMSIPAGTWVEGLGACSYYCAWAFLMRANEHLDEGPRFFT